MLGHPVRTCHKELMDSSAGSKTSRRQRFPTPRLASSCHSILGTLAIACLPKDVVVFNEIFSKAGSSIFRRLCNPKWRRDGKYATKNVLDCDSGHFASATRVLNPAGYVKISGRLAASFQKQGPYYRPQMGGLSLQGRPQKGPPICRNSHLMSVVLQRPAHVWSCSMYRRIGTSIMVLYS